MSEISTRIWLDERMWNEVASRAVLERTTVRELLPQLVSQSLGGAATLMPEGDHQPVPSSAGSSAQAQTPEAGLPVIPLSDVYCCGVCGAEVRLGGVSNHLGKHKKEREATEAERS
jgi:hypothetical protein